MSQEGRLRRGKQYHAMRNVDGVYSNGVINNPNKMEELNEYLDSIKKPEPEVKEKKPKKGE